MPPSLRYLVHFWFQWLKNDRAQLEAVQNSKGDQWN